MSGDKLARGAVRANFGAPQVNEEKYKEALGEDAGPKANFGADIPQDVTLPTEKQPSLGFRAVQDRVVVRRVDVEQKVGSFYVPDLAKELPAQGVVVAVGPGRYVDGQFVPVTVVPGDHILFGKFAGAEAKVGFEQFLILKEEDIFVVLDN
jgi:chaperonin GroES